MISFFKKIVLLLTSYACCQIYTSYHWHLQQPIYWPDESNFGNTYQKAWESMVYGGENPQNNLEEIFGSDDRVAAYQYRIRNSISLMSGSRSGAQISYTGCLIENINSLSSNNSLDYYSGWNNSFIESSNWMTPGMNPKLDIVIVPYHHPIAPLIDENTLRKEIQIYKHLYPDIWGNENISVGFFPPELSFSTRIIKVLVEEGIEWVYVGNNHISRSVENFPITFGSNGEMCDPPNPADQINTDQSNWFNKQISRGCGPTNAYPFSYQPHYAQHIDPESGQIYKIKVIPVAMAMSWEEGAQSYGLYDIQQIQDQNDTQQPMLIVFAHDGDNFYSGGYSYYMEDVPNFTNEALSNGITPTVINEYLDTHPLDPNDIIHVEDGSWVNADGDFGSPDFINWNWPLMDGNGNYDVLNGWSEDARNWAVITAAQNRIETAENIQGPLNIASIQNPDLNGSNFAELAWHYFLPSVTSGYMYYGTALDMEVKPTIACNNAVQKADLLINETTNDQTPPTIWIPQQFPHNPGGIGYGALWNYQQVIHDKDFWVWSFIYDVSGIELVEFCYRIDNDGKNPLYSIQNETYLGGNEVSDWICNQMSLREFPAENIFNFPGIDFIEMPEYISDQYYIHFQDYNVIEDGNKLLDYYVKAIDTYGNIKKSPIQHTYIGDGNINIQNTVDWYPDMPVINNVFTINYNSNLGNLNTPIFIHLGYNDWSEILSPDAPMIYNQSLDRWQYSFNVPPYVEQINFVFNNGQGSWDNNNGNDWNVNVQDILLGDVNSDNELDILDIIIVLSFILFDNQNYLDADFNDDGNIDIIDVIVLVDFVLI